jgi:iron complex transport system substrate-binding protein
VFALGQGHRIVGVTAFCDYPPEAASKEVIGGYLDPNLERITALAPELIILPGKLEKIAELARQNGIPVLHAHMDNLQTIRDGIMRIGQALDCSDRAQALWAGMQRELDHVRYAVNDRPRPRVLLVHTRRDHDLNNIFTVGRTSFISELADIAGSENIFSDVEQAYFEASKESVVLRAPEIIIEFHAGEALSEAEQARFVADWQQLPSVPAVRDGRIHLFLESYGLRPGPRVAHIAAGLARMVHPGVQVTVP